MAQIKVSALTALTATDGNEELLINDGGTSKKVTINNVLHDNSIRAEHYVDGSIATAHIADNAITSAKLGVDVIVAEDVAANAITVAELAANAVTTVKILDDNVTAAKLANSINTDIATGVTGNTTANAALPKAGGAMTGAITTNSTFDGVDIATRDGVLTSTTATAAAALPKTGGAMTGAITTNSTFDGVDVAAASTLATNAMPKSGGAFTGAVTTNSTIDGRDVAADGVLATAALPKSGGAMTGAITTNSTFDGRDVATDGTKLDGIASSSNNYVHPNHSGEVTSSADGATVVADNIIDEANLKVSNAPTNGYALTAQSGNTGGLTWAASGVADGAVTAAKLGADAVTAAKIGDDVINSEHYAAGSIDAEHLASDSVTEAKMAANSVDSQAYVDGSIDTAHIANLNVTGAKLALDHRSANATDDVKTGNQHDYIFFDADVGISFFSANAEDMRLTDAGALHVDGDIVAFSSTISDETLKYDINPIDHALDKINTLKGVTYKYLKDGMESAGLLAQDVEKVMPCAVSERKLPLHKNDGKSYKTLNYDNLHALLIESIKELTAKVEKLEKK
jgi:hypothetical protein